MTLSEAEVKGLKPGFPLLRKKDIVYLDNAATTQKPRQVIDAVSGFYTDANANVHRGIYRLSLEATENYEKARESIAGFINAGRHELVFTRGTTESINLLSYALTPLLGSRKDIVLTEMEHHSNLVPWQQLARRTGMNLKFIRMKDDFTLDHEDAREKITSETAVLSIVHVSNALGTINDVKTLVKLGRKAGAITVIDAAQSAAHMPIDVKDIGCDFLAFSAHKMLGPTGIGALYGRKELLEKMDIFQSGGDMISTVTYEGAEWNDVPMKFEAGTPNVAGAIGFAAAVDYLQEIGMENVAARDSELSDYAMGRLKEIDGITLYSAGPGKSVGAVSFNIGDAHPHDVVSLLDDEDICIRGGHHCAMPLMGRLGVPGTCRASFSIYTTKEDIDSLVAALKKAGAVLR